MHYYHTSCHQSSLGRHLSTSAQTTAPSSGIPGTRVDGPSVEPGLGGLTWIIAACSGSDGIDIGTASDLHSMMLFIDLYWY